MIRFLTAGESHGPALAAIIEGMPANLTVDLDRINHELSRRQMGYGRGGRMKIEKDRITVLSGIRFNKTLGSPISFVLHNKDWPNWEEIMSVSKGQSGREISRPRPGHADLSGSLKYDFDDMRNVLERSSARETAMRVAVGGFARQLLEYFGIKIFSHVLQIGSVQADPARLSDILKSDRINELADQSPVRCLDKEASQKMVDYIDSVKREGDTSGGLLQVIIRGVPPGLGSYVQWDRKLDGLLAQAVLSIQAVKGVEFGSGFSSVAWRGSQFHDEIFYDGKTVFRKTNRAGGIEGGMSNGEDIIVNMVMKPIPTLMKPLNSVDMATKEPFQAHKERSDITAVPACAVIAEAAVAPVVANVLLEKFGADHLEDMKEAFDHYRRRIAKRMEK